MAPKGNACPECPALKERVTALEKLVKELKRDFQDETRRIYDKIGEESKDRNKADQAFVSHVGKLLDDLKTCIRSEFEQKVRELHGRISGHYKEMVAFMRQSDEKDADLKQEIGKNTIWIALGAAVAAEILKILLYKFFGVQI